MTLKIYQADAFSSKVFGGNPAAVIPLAKGVHSENGWLPNNVLQQIAAENNLSETAFIVPTGGETDYHLRWFTPSIEVRLCGHATLATAHILWNHLGFEKQTITFDTLSGVLKVSRDGDIYTLDFPADMIENRKKKTDFIHKILGIKPLDVFKGRDDYMIILSSQSEVEALKPDFVLLKDLNARGLIATALGDEVDFVSRCFFPEVGIEEDPVTGSAHTTMTPYWAEKIGKNTLTAIQLSSRRGELTCVLRGNRVDISGSAVTYMIGEIFI